MRVRDLVVGLRQNGTLPASPRWLADVVDHSYLVYLVASPDSLEQRLIERGEPEKIPYARTRLELINELPYPRVDTSNISAAEAADRIAGNIQEWVAGDA